MPTRLSESRSGSSSFRRCSRSYPIHQVTVSLALRVGQIDGESQAKGIRLPLSDLLIGVTALELGYSVATGNLRHFQMIPGLSVVRL